MDDKLAADLAAMWQSEFAAMAADRELRESYNALLALWASTVTALPLRGTGLDRATGGASAAEPAGAAAAAAASDARDDEVERLARRVAELEQRLAGLERGPPGA